MGLLFFTLKEEEYMSLGTEIVKTIGVEGGKSLIRTVAGVTLSLVIYKLLSDNKTLNDDLNYLYEKYDNLEEDLEDLNKELSRYRDDRDYDDYEERRYKRSERRDSRRSRYRR